jgi:hypothetical protein
VNDLKVFINLPVSIKLRSFLAEVLGFLGLWWSLNFYFDW